MTTKTCKTCSERKPLGAFSPTKPSAAGETLYQSYCKACRSAKQNAVLAAGMTDKRCIKCRKCKPVADFRATAKGGLTAVCSVCIDVRSAYYRDNGGAEAQRMRRRMSLTLAFARVPAYTRGHLSPVVRYAELAA